MPNYCKGILKVRGSKEALLKFLKEEIKKENSFYNKDVKSGKVPKYESIEIEEDGSQKLTYVPYYKCTVCIIGLKKGYLDENIRWSWIDDKEDYIQCLKVVQVERLEVEQFAYIARKYNIDMRIKGYNSKKGISQEFEIIQGNITMYKEKTYKNYVWEVDDPRQ